MQKNNNKNKVDKYTAKMRIIGGIICLLALITAFVVGLFVGKSINKNDNISANNDITLIADTDYVLNGTYVFNETINLSLVSSSNTDFRESINFKAHIYGNDMAYDCNAFRFEFYDNVKYFYYMYGDNYSTPCYNSNSNRWNFDIYRTVYINNQTVSSTFYNWFVANSTVYTPPVITYDISYNFNNIIYNGYELPTTVDDDSSYSLKFLTNGIEGYFPLEDYINVSATNCEIINIQYGLQYYPVDGMQYNLVVDIDNIVGDVVIDFSGESILDNSTVIYSYSNISSFEITAYNMVNCNLWKYQNNFIIYPNDLNSQYSFTLEITPLDDISTPTINIINGGGSVIYDYFSKITVTDDATGDESLVFRSDIIIRPNTKGVIIQLRIFSSDYSAFDELDTSFVSWLGTAVGGFFDFYIMPGLSLGIILGTIVMIGFVIWVIRVFMGG